jgi:hypothetical protein
MPTSFASRLITGVLSVTLLAAPVVAQVDENAPVDESGEVIDELVVIGTRPGDRDKVDPVRKEFWRQQMFESVELMRLEEEEDWRDSELTYRSGAKSRMVWGYDPGADREMYRGFNFDSNPGVTTKPATLFRAQF